MSDVESDQHDPWLDDNGPAAIVLKRKLIPIEGRDSWIFPPTFAHSESADEDDEGGGGDYQIDSLPSDESRKNVCLIDSVGSQANRIEPIFKRPSYAALVPQQIVKMKDGVEVNLLDVGHRAADAAVRFSKELGPKLWDAFKKHRDNHDCSELAKLAPTSLVFGVWDSRATGTKIQRIVRSVIRAYNVTEAKRSATYQAAYDYTGNDIIKPELDKGSGKNNPLSQEGFKYSLATRTHGGILVNGDIQQEALINLVALRTLTSDLMTKRYLLGLALVGLSYRDQEGFNLREGCLLCAASKLDLDGKWKVVNFDGTDSPVTLTHDAALAYAQASATDFKVEQPAMADEFDKAVAEEWIEIEKKERKAIAKRMHPGAAIAERRKKAAQDDANDPLGALLKLVNAVSLGRKPAKSKPRVMKRQAFNAVEKWCKEVQSADVEDSIKTLARELLNSIENDTDSHVTKDSMKEKIGSLQNPTTESAAPNTESTVGNSEAVE